MMFGYPRRTSDGNWYLVPEDKLKSFANMVDVIETAVIGKSGAIDVFHEQFEQYRISGGIINLRIPMELLS